MSISTQPNAPHASLPRALSARLNAPSTTELAASRTGPSDKVQRPKLTVMGYSFMPGPMGGCTAQAPAESSILSCLPQLNEPPAQGLLPALASELASQLQARKRASLRSQPSCRSQSGPAQREGAIVTESSMSDLLKQSSKRPRLTPTTCPAARLAQQAASLEDEFAAMKGGTAIIADKPAWVAAARHTAHQVSDFQPTDSMHSQQVLTLCCCSAVHAAAWAHSACPMVLLVVSPDRWSSKIVFTHQAAAWQACHSMHCS